MSSDMTGPLSGMPDSTTTNAQVANASLPAEERPKRRPYLFKELMQIQVGPAVAQ